MTTCLSAKKQTIKHIQRESLLEGLNFYGIINVNPTDEFLTNSCMLLLMNVFVCELS